MSDRSIEIKATALMRLWQAYFYKFAFDDKVFKSVVTSYKKSEILQLEAALKELMDCKKMNSVADDTEQVPKKSETDIAEIKEDATESDIEQETETVYIKKVYVGVKKYATVKYEGHNIFEIV